MIVLLLLLLLLSCITVPVASKMETAIIQDYKFFTTPTGQELVIKGIDYYPRPNANRKLLNQNSLDLYGNEHRHIWERDIQYFQQLGINAIRLYAVNATINHDAFMCALEEAGIYVIVALAHDCPTCAITKDQAPACYPKELKLQGQAIINEFSKYTNTLAFSAGNEVNHFAPPNNPQWNAPCQKRFIYDMRQYMKSCINIMRHIPIGLVSADGANREDVATYYNCIDEDDDENSSSSSLQTAEWYGLNSYVTCDGNVTTYEKARGFHLLQKSFDRMKYSIPVVLTEFGCLSETFPNVDDIEGQRTFLQAKWLLEESTLREQFVGGFAFEYSMEMENAKSESPYPFTKFGHQSYGIGYFQPENCDDVNITCTYHPLPSFNNLKESYATKPILTLKDEFQPDSNRLQRSTCPAQFPKLSELDWSAVDNTENLSCPPKRYNHFQCPAKYKTLFSSSANNNNNTGRLHHQFFMVAIATLLAVICIISILVLVRRKIMNHHRSQRGVYLTVSESEEDGLLSMKTLLNNKDGKFSPNSSYQAISSSSSESSILSKTAYV